MPDIIKRLTDLSDKFDQYARSAALDEHHAYVIGQLGAAMSYSARTQTWAQAAEELRQLIQVIESEK